MIRRLLPTVRWGGMAGSSLRDNDSDVEGWYLACQWLGLQVEMSFAKVQR